MIRIRRGKEPAELPEIRERRLAIAQDHHEDDTLERRHITEYDAVKPALRRQQNLKCCYCERPYLEAKGYDVEHYRPAMSADRGNGVVHGGYWWLAWNWDNLMFACNNCNRWEKNDLFPLDAGSVPLRPGQQPPGRERPLLIDPTAESPTDHIQFHYLASQWMPLARSGSRKGFQTIQALNLARTDLLTDYDHHVKTQVSPFVNRLKAYMANQDAGRVREFWKHGTSILISPKSPFSALSHDAVDHFIPAAERRAWKLRLTRPR